MENHNASYERTIVEGVQDPRQEASTLFGASSVKMRCSHMCFGFLRIEVSFDSRRIAPSTVSFSRTTREPSFHVQERTDIQVIGVSSSSTNVEHDRRALDAGESAFFALLHSSSADVPSSPTLPARTLVLCSCLNYAREDDVASQTCCTVFETTHFPAFYDCLEMSEAHSVIGS